MDGEEIPLKHITSNVTEATRARFDSLLQAALSSEQSGQKKREHRKRNKNVESVTRPRQETVEVECHQDSRHSSPAHITQVTSGDYEDENDDDIPVQEKRKSKTRHTKPLRHIHHFNDDDDDDDDETSLFDINNVENGSKSPKKIIIKSGSLESYPQCSTKSENNLRRGRTQLQNEIFEENPSEENICNNWDEEFPQKRKRPVPLPRIKTANKTNNELETAVRHAFEISERSGDNLSPDVAEQASHGVDGGGETPCSEESTSEIVETLERTQTLKKKSPPCKPKRKSKGTKLALAVEPEVKPSEFVYEHIIGIFVHRSDCLQADRLVRHPLVKVQLIDATTGEYLKKSNRERPVSFYYESKEVDYILPLMTEVFDFKARRCIVPCWEELLIFNEDMQYMMKNDPPVIIMFEILDFVTFSVASSRYKRLGPEGGWHKVAWAFLKPVGANGHLNVEKKVRLQLYKPRHSKRSNCDNCDVYSWWSGGVWKRYPGTLYVTVSGISPPQHLPPTLRSRTALQQEITSSDVALGIQEEEQPWSEGENTLSSEKKLTASSIIAQTTWSRMPAQSCKIPNQRKLLLPTAAKGCLSVKFSHSGLLLACALSGEESHPIALFTIPDGKEFAQFSGHQGLVYDLNWSGSDTMLLSASADCTACIWDVENKKPCFLQMLPHPSFVYCAQFRSGKSWLLATGCFDQVVRLWSRGHKGSQYELVQELDGHTGFVNSLCFDRFGTLITADSVGCILVWSCGASTKVKKQFTPWKAQREMALRELKGTVVNKLVLHPGGQRLLVHARDSLLVMVDLATATTIQWFKGAINQRVQMSACISPCGGLVFAPSEDGTVCVWNSDTGEQLAVYSGLQFHRRASGVDYHPYEHMAAFSFHGTASLVVCSYSKLASGTELGLQLLSRQPDLNTGSARELSLKYLMKGINHKKLKSNKNGVTVDNEITSGSNVTEDLAGSEGYLSWNNESLLASTHISTSKDLAPNTFSLAKIIDKMDEVLSVSSSRSGGTHIPESSMSQETPGRSAARARRDSLKSDVSGSLPR